VSSQLATKEYWFMKRYFSQLVWIMLLLFTCLNTRAADKLTITIGNQTITAWRTADLESAKKEAAAEHKAIGWIASSARSVTEPGTIAQSGTRGATLHAFYALRNRVVLVFEDGFAENHQVLQLVDDAIHTPNHNPTLPVVVFLNPDATEVLAKVTFEPDFVKRAHALADALDQVKARMNAIPEASKK
jgi:hypothetical protein